MKRLVLLVTTIGFLLSGALVSAQDDAPYLYYYSQMLGGLIIEHPDGSDSRLIGADLIPAGLTGIGGPGWSPSGKYFAAYGMITRGESVIPDEAYLVNAQGRSFENFPQVKIGNWREDLPKRLYWSPTGEDLLLVIGATGEALTFLVFDASTDRVLTEYTEVYGLSNRLIGFFWEIDQQRIRFYSHSDGLNDERYYQITMLFDGTVLKIPVTEAEFERNRVESTPAPFNSHNSLTVEQGISPSGRYEVNSNTLHDNLTGKDTQLPAHSQGTICREYRWDKREEYILTLDGTAVAGGGCGLAVLGITDVQGSIWRELGGCYWTQICATWLPAQVDVHTLVTKQSNAEAGSGMPTSTDLQPTEFSPTSTPQPTLQPG